MDKKFTRIFSFILAFMMLFQFSMPAITSFVYDEKEQGLAENNVDVKKENEKISKDSNKAPPKMVEPLKLDENKLESSFSGEDEVVPEISEMKDVLKTVGTSQVVNEADDSKIETISVDWMTKDDVKDDKENKEKPLNGAKFKLYYGKANDIANAKVIKDGDKDLILEVKNGKINLNNLIKGDYFLVELGVKDLVDDLLKDEGYEKYLVSGNAQYDKNNKLSFSVDDAGNIIASKDFKHFVNYERPHSDKKIVNETKDKDLSKVKKNNYEIFEDIEFNVDVEIPKNVQDYSKLGFKDKLMLEDKTTNDLEYLENSFVVKCGDVTLEKDKDYTIKFNETKNEFDFSLITNGKASDKLKDKVTVSYKAQFKNVTTIVANGNYKNHVDFVFNNSKFNNNKDRYEKKETKFTTYGFKVKKVNDTIFEMNAKRS